MSVNLFFRRNILCQDPEEDHEEAAEAADLEAAEASAEAAVDLAGEALADLADLITTDRAITAVGSSDRVITEEADASAV